MSNRNVLQKRHVKDAAVIQKEMIKYLSIHRFLILFY